MEIVKLVHFCRTAYTLGVPRGYAHGARTHTHTRRHLICNRYPLMALKCRAEEGENHVGGLAEKMLDNR